MKKIAMLAFVILFALPALASQDGVIVGPGTEGDFIFVPPDRDLMDGWNDDQPPAEGTTYAGSCFGFSYIPDVCYLLERIEWYAGDIGGTVTVEVRGDGGEGVPNGPVLGSVTYQEVPPRSWQGADLDEPVLMTPGTQYWVVYSVIVGASVSCASSGVIIPHWWGTDCVTWSGPWNSLYWMARFYGLAATPAEAGTRSTVKSLY